MCVCEGHSCLAFARAGLGYIYDKTEITGDNVRYAIGERKRRKKTKRSKSSRTGDKLHSIVCEKESGDQMESENECVSKARQCAQGRRNGKGQCPMVRASRRRLTRQGDKSKTKER